MQSESINIDDDISKDSEWDFKDVETFSEHIYDCSFDEIVKKGYNPEDDKQRVDINNPPIVFSKLRSGIPTVYKITKTQGLVFGSKLGVSILQHDSRIKTIIDCMGDSFGEINEFNYTQLNSIQRYSYATSILDRRFTVPGLEWVIEFIRDTHESLGMTIDQMYVECYLLGLCEAKLIPDHIRHQIKQENNKFWDYIAYRIQRLK